MTGMTAAQLASMCYTPNADHPLLRCFCSPFTPIGLPSSLHSVCLKHLSEKSATHVTGQPMTHVAHIPLLISTENRQ